MSSLTSRNKAKYKQISVDDKVMVDQMDIMQTQGRFYADLYAESRSVNGKKLKSICIMLKYHLLMMVKKNFVTSQEV